LLLIRQDATDGLASGLGQHFDVIFKTAPLLEALHPLS
jgi:hypothetical protein